MPDRLVALTVRQPWASAIIYGGKDVENRVWQTGYRGRLLIHAGKAVDWDAPDHAWTAAGVAPYRRGAGRQHWTASLPLGVIIGGVDLTGCHLDAECWEYREGHVHHCTRWAIRDQFHWTLTEPRPFRQPVPAVGKLGLWQPDVVAVAVDAILEQCA